VSGDKLGRLRENAKLRCAGRWFRCLGIIILVGFTLWAAFHFVRVIKLPAQVEKLEKVQDLVCRTAFSYRVFPLPSLLYPDARPIEEGKVFFTKVTRDAEIRFTASLEPNPPLALSGTYEVWLVLEAPELWQRTDLLQGETRFAGEKGVPVKLSGTYNLDLQSRMAFLAAVEEETSISPRSGYNVLLRPVIRLQNDLFAREKKEFVPEFGFNVKAYQFTPLGDLKQDHELHLTAKTLQPTVVPIFLWTLPIPVARFLFGLLMLPGIIAAAAWLKNRLHLMNERRSVCRGKYINHRYRNRIIRVENLDSTLDDRPVLKVKSFGDLLRIADELEKPIVLAQTADEFGTINAYHVLDDPNL